VSSRVHYYVEQHGSTHSSRRAQLSRHVERVVSRRDEPSGIFSYGHSAGIIASCYTAFAISSPATRGTLEVGTLLHQNIPIPLYDMP